MFRAKRDSLFHFKREGARGRGKIKLREGLMILYRKEEGRLKQGTLLFPSFPHHKKGKKREKKKPDIKT